MKKAQDGTTIEIRGPVYVDRDIEVSRAVRLVGSSSGPLDMGVGRLLVSSNTPKCVGNKTSPILFHVFICTLAIAEGRVPGATREGKGV